MVYKIWSPGNTFHLQPHSSKVFLMFWIPICFCYNIETTHHMLHFCSKNESKHVGEQQEFLFIKQIKEHKKNVYTDSLFDATMIKRKRYDS